MHNVDVTEALSLSDTALGPAVFSVEAAEAAILAEIALVVTPPTPDRICTIDLAGRTSTVNDEPRNAEV